jgi:hypothetical protein
MMPVYTVHAPATSNWDLRTTDRFTFVRDGFHVWAALFGVVWLAWNRLWLAFFLVDGLLALLLGFEASTLKRWNLSRRNWRQLDIVVADDEEAAERRFFDRWTAKQRAPGNDQSSVDRGAPPPTRDVPGQAFSRPLPPSRDEINGLFPEPGASR